MKEYTCRRLFPSGCQLNVGSNLLGEGPVWDHRTGTLFWIDILGHTVQWFCPQTNSYGMIAVPEDMIGFAVPTAEKDKLLCGSQLGLFVLRVSTSEIIRTSHPEQHIPGNRFNDAKVDPMGRLFAGTMAINEKDVTGSLYRFSSPYEPPTVVPAVGTVAVSNGLVWSPCGRWMYYLDSPTQRVSVLQYDMKRGIAKEQKTLATLTEGFPDGMTIDSEGCLWVAVFGGGCVLRFSPSGKTIGRISVPAPNVTSVCFGGPYMKQLFITTASVRTPKKFQKDAGHVFVADLDVPGFPMTPFSLVMTENAHLFHGKLGNPEWPLPACVCASSDLARPHYSDIDASEFLDSDAVLSEKVFLFASMIARAKEFCVYTGAGLSTAAGIGDYASKGKGSVVSKEGSINRLELQPTYSHRVLASLEKAGYLKQWVQQNHDGLAQKSGFPFEKLNEIHGSWFDKYNPVVFMDGQLRPDLFERMKEWAAKADLVLAVGTSLCGMTADCVAHQCAQRSLASQDGLGLVVINLQRTPMDDRCSLRIFAKVDDVMKKLKRIFALKIDSKTYSGYPVPGTNCPRKAQPSKK